MISFIFYSHDINNLPQMRAMVEECCTELEGTYISFEYPMDLLDYINTARPQNCVVFYDTDTLEDALEYSYRISEMTPRCRFVLFSRESGDVENLFYRGVTYYIPKPYGKENILRCASNFKNFFDDQSGRTVLLKTKKGDEIISLSDINYVMSDKRKVVFNLRDREDSFYYKLDEIEIILGNGFLRCHQSFIVNMRKIKCFVEDGIMLLDESFVPVSRKKYFAAKRQYLTYITGGRLA